LESIPGLHKRLKIRPLQEKVEQLKHALHQSERPLRVAADSQLFRAAIQKRGSILLTWIVILSVYGADTQLQLISPFLR
jgi:hypothetical protein